MSADDYMYVDYHPDDVRGAFSVTRGFDSDEKLPSRDSRRSGFFDTWLKADAAAESEYAEYGVHRSVAFNQYIRAAVAAYEANGGA